MPEITSEILFYVCIGLLVLAILNIIWNIQLEDRIKKLMRGKNGKSLEDSFLSMNADIAEYKKFRKDLENYLNKVERKLKKTIRGVKNINFNAFSGAESGAKSFATAFVNEEGDGIIISSLHARDRMSIFTKEIKKGKSEISLSEEEQSALTKALESCNI